MDEEWEEVEINEGVEESGFDESEREARCG